MLEFWATWCSPCIASIPHLNQLVESLNEAKFQFISIDDEETKDVQNFLTKKKMLGWVGVDASGNVFRQYGVEARPTTVILDGDGKVVAVTDIDSVSVADLEAVAAGREATFKPAMEITNSNVATNLDVEHALFAVSVSNASPDAQMAIAKHPPTGTDFLGQDADGVLTNAFDIFKDRYVLKGSLPGGRYDLRVKAFGVSETASDSAVQQAVLAALHLEIQTKTISQAAYVLHAMDSSKRLLSPSASTRTVKRGCWRNRYLVMNGSMDDLAYVLATGLENPVVNQTGVEGKYDVRFEAAGGDIESLNAVLRKTFGLELVPGGKEMQITVLEVSMQSQ